jgi:hypothetical protein
MTPPTIRRLLVAFALVALMPAVSSVPAFAQGAGDEAPKQVALTQAQIDGLLAAQPEMSAVQGKAAGGGDQPDPKLEGRMDAIAKKHGFADLAAYEGAIDSVGIVMAGMDPETKSYVGPAALIKKQIAQVEADKTLPAKDKAQAVKELKDSLAAAGSVKPAPGNVDVVAKNYEKLSEAFQGAE